MKKKIGRPKGSKNKPKTDKISPRIKKAATDYTQGFIDGFLAHIKHQKEIDTARQIW